MTRAQLHKIPDFANLFDDPRFIAAVTWARANFANKGTDSAGEWRGWYAALEHLENLRNIPQPKPEPVPQRPPYTSSSTRPE